MNHSGIGVFGQMKRMRKIMWNKMLRCIFAAAVLLYVLTPQTGFCSCPDCGCSNKIPTSKPRSTDNEESRPLNGCPCCKKKAEPKQSRPCCSENGLSDSNSDKCSCSCSETKLPPPTVQRTSGHSFQDLEDTRDLQSITFTFPLIPEALSEFVFLRNVFETPTSRLPVRLHLLLLVFLN